MRYIKEKMNISRKEKLRKERPLTSLASKRRHIKLFSPELPDSSRLLMKTVQSMRGSTLFVALRSVY